MDREHPTHKTARQRTNAPGQAPKESFDAARTVQHPQRPRPHLMGAAVKNLGRAGRGNTAIGAKRKRTHSSPIDKARGDELVWGQVSGLFEACRHIEGMVFVYFIGEPDSGPVKIGVSKDPIGRLRAMQTGNPRRLRIEHVLAGNVQTERLLHEFWERYVIRSAVSIGKPDMAPGTEWFSPAIRSELFPIVQDAARRQAELMGQGGNLMGEACDQLVRDAHTDSGFVAQGRDPTTFLAAGAGYVTKGRSSRI